MKKQEHPYSELYVEDAMITVAFSFDYAVRALNLTLEEYLDKFLNFQYIHLLETGNPHYVAGMSGCELALEICGLDDGPKSPPYEPKLEYWIGWILSYYQWLRNISYKKIIEKFPLKRLIFSYPTFHEETRARMIEYMDEVILGKKSDE